VPLEKDIFWDWTLALDMAAAANKTYTWGSFDCIVWALDVTHDCTYTDIPQGDGKVDLAANIRGTYADAAGAAARVAALTGGGGLIEFLHSLWSTYTMKRVPLTWTQRANLVVVNAPDPQFSIGGKALGVVEVRGEQVVIPGAVGLVRVPIQNWIVALDTHHPTVDHTKCIFAPAPKNEGDPPYGSITAADVFPGLAFNLPFTG